MAIAGATTNCIVTKCTKWDNTNNESKEVINLNPYVVCMWLSDRDGQIKYKIKLIYIHYWIWCYINIKSKTIKEDIPYNHYPSKSHCRHNIRQSEPKAIVARN